MQQEWPYASWKAEDEPQFHLAKAQQARLLAQVKKDLRSSLRLMLRPSLAEARA